MSPATQRPIVISPDTERGGGDLVARTPPGQVLTKKWPVLHYGDVPDIDPATWSLRIDGLCARPYTLTLETLQQLPTVDLLCDIHCVTRWSRLDNIFTGVPTQTILELARPHPDARFVIQHGSSDPGNDWRTNVSRDEFIADDAVIAWRHDGEPLTPDHGGPVRTVIPSLYFWKSAKWLNRLELVADDAPGFWEVNGYHMHGDPWTEERYAW